MVEDRADRHAERGLAVVTAVPVLHSGGIVRFAVGADRLVVPSCLFEVGDAVFLGGKLLEYLGDVHGWFLLRIVGDAEKDNP